ncbi:hypothetical protein DPMN_131812 [Dreissena polymorpha]|uniref:Secreted protein n=1 Tax=Dreissena polymorpha TaxID=45954 RepID=A0A9D4FTV3_DREPO|nr:hypothetical protein DPMN_131812 [Dreissena polymorpha]
MWAATSSETIRMFGMAALAVVMFDAADIVDWLGCCKLKVGTLTGRGSRGTIPVLEPFEPLEPPFSASLSNCSKSIICLPLSPSSGLTDLGPFCVPAFHRAPLPLMLTEIKCDFIQKL